MHILKKIIFFRLKILTQILCIICVGVLFSGCTKQNEVYTLHGKTMGTTWSAKVVLPGLSKLTYHEVQDLIQKKLNYIDSLASTWKPHSEVSRFNALPQRRYMKFSLPIFHVIKRSKYWYYKTNRNFDITLEPLIKAWGFDNIKVQQPPTSLQITRLLQSVGVRYLQLSKRSMKIRKLKKGLAINLSGIVKGYAVDYVAKTLETKGIDNFMIEVGGEVYVHGKRPDGSLWSIGVVNPAQPDQVYSILNVQNMGIATSGNYLNYYMYKGKRYTHILNPSTGYPISVQYPISVTVVMPTTEDADAVATSMIVYGVDVGISVANRHHWPVYFVISRTRKDGTSSVTGYASNAYKLLEKK